MNTAKHIEAKQNWINRESKRIEADAGESQSPERNLEWCLRGNQGSPSRPVARGRIEETCWMDERRIDRGDLQLDDQRLSQEVEAKRRKLQEAIVKDPTMKDVRWMALCRREGANADIASNIRMETPCGVERIRECVML